MKNNMAGRKILIIRWFLLLGPLVFLGAGSDQASDSKGDRQGRLKAAETRLKKAGEHLSNEAVHFKPNQVGAMEKEARAYQEMLAGTLELRVREAGGLWMQLEAPEEMRARFKYVRSPLTAPHTADSNLDAFLDFSGMIISEQGHVTGGEIVQAPGAEATYKFSTTDWLVGDIDFIGEDPVKIGPRFDDFTKPLNTAWFSNQNGTTDRYGGAVVALGADSPGPESGGSLAVVAYGRGSGPLANSIRFQRRCAPGKILPSMIINGDGEVGIGTDSPTENLEVMGNVQAGDAERPAGFVVFDTVTRKPYAIEVKDGKLVIRPWQ